MNTRRIVSCSRSIALGLALGLPGMLDASAFDGGRNATAGSISDALDRYVQRLAERPTAHRPVPKAPDMVEEEKDPQLFLALADQLDRHLVGPAASLRGAVETMARESVRAGFGLPLSMTKKLLQGTRPLASMLAGHARSLKEAGAGCSVLKLHRAVEAVLNQVQNTNFLYARCREEIETTRTALGTLRKAVDALEDETPSLRYALRAMREAQGKGADNLGLARDAVGAQREIVGRLFTRMTELLAFLDEINGKNWSLAPAQVTLAAHPRGLERAAEAFMTSLREMQALGRDNRTTRDLFKTHYKALVGIFQTYARAPRPLAAPSGADELKRARSRMTEATAALAAVMAERKVELTKLDAWVEELQALRSPSVEVGPMPDWLLTDVSGQKRPLLPRSRPEPLASRPHEHGEKAAGGTGGLADADFEAALDLVDRLAEDARGMSRPALASPLSDLMADRDRRGPAGVLD